MVQVKRRTAEPHRLMYLDFLPGTLGDVCLLLSCTGTTPRLHTLTPTPARRCEGAAVKAVRGTEACLPSAGSIPAGIVLKEFERELRMAASEASEPFAPLAARLLGVKEAAFRVAFEENVFMAGVFVEGVSCAVHAGSCQHICCFLQGVAVAVLPSRAV